MLRAAQVSKWPLTGLDHFQLGREMRGQVIVHPELLKPTEFSERNQSQSHNVSNDVLFLFGSQQFAKHRHTTAPVVDFLQDVIVGRTPADRIGQTAVLDSSERRSDALFRGFACVANTAFFLEQLLALGDIGRGVKLGKTSQENENGHRFHRFAKKVAV